MNRLHPLIFLLLVLAGTAQASALKAEYTLRVEVDAATAAGSSTTDRAAIKSASLLGAVEVGKIADAGSLAGGIFRLNSVISGHRIVKLFVSEDALQIVRTSEAQVRQGHLVTTRYSERRGQREPFGYAADIAKGRYEFRRANAQTGSGRLQFSNVDIAALPYLFLGRAPPTAPLSVAYTDGRALRNATFQPCSEPLRIGLPSSPMVRRRSSVQKTAADPLMEIWIRSTDRFPLRVRLGLSYQCGAIADAWITQVPPAFRAG